jgi:hypothetical protein
MTEATDDRPCDDEPSGGTERDRPMLALLKAYQRQGWRRSAHTRVEAYLAQQSGLLDDAEAVLDMIYQEVSVREQAGESPRLEEYLSRFPHVASLLNFQFELEGAFDPDTLVPSAADVIFGNRTSPSPATLPTVPGHEILGVLGRVAADGTTKLADLGLAKWVGVNTEIHGTTSTARRSPACAALMSHESTRRPTSCFRR